MHGTALLHNRQQTVLEWGASIEVFPRQVRHRRCCTSELKRRFMEVVSQLRTCDLVRAGIVAHIRKWRYKEEETICD